MKYSAKGFRPFYHQFALFPIDAIGNTVKDFEHSHEADSVLTYGYVDHETGFRFEVLSTASSQNGTPQIFNDRPEGIRVFIKAEVLNDTDAIVLENRDELCAANKETIDSIIDGYECDEEIMNSRTMEFLDESRDPICIDDVQVLLYKEGNQTEACWVRISGLQEHFIVGEMLNEPYQDFGYHIGDTIGFFVQKTDDDRIICVCDMNPTAKITREDLKDGLMLKEAIGRFNNERNEENFFNILELLRDSDVWVPCTCVLSENDQTAIEKMVDEAGDDLSSMKGMEFSNKDQIRMIPDILQNGDDFFFPVFSSDEEMGEYGDGFSKIETEFLHAINLARNNEKELKGIVINAFTEPFVLDKELFDIVEKMKTRLTDTTRN
ncbi:MAG: SseB family protein [Erysipelotrichaceae bacterium]|nr:SseB family protein [Erysipelotrichaceae bacterium]